MHRHILRSPEFAKRRERRKKNYFRNLAVFGANCRHFLGSIQKCQPDHSGKSLHLLSFLNFSRITISYTVITKQNLRHYTLDCDVIYGRPLKFVWNKHLNKQDLINLTFQTLVFGAYFLRWLAESKDHKDKVSILKPLLLDSLVKNVISSKTKTPEVILKVRIESWFYIQTLFFRPSISQTSFTSQSSLLRNVMISCPWSMF